MHGCAERGSQYKTVGCLLPALSPSEQPPSSQSPEALSASAFCPGAEPAAVSTLLVSIHFQLSLVASSSSYSQLLLFHPFLEGWNSAEDVKVQTLLLDVGRVI